MIVKRDQIVKIGQKLKFQIHRAAWEAKKSNDVIRDGIFPITS